MSEKPTFHELITGKKGATAKDAIEFLKKYNGLPPLVFGNPSHQNDAVYNGFITASHFVADEKVLIHWPKKPQPMGIMNLPMTMHFSEAAMADFEKVPTIKYECRCELFALEAPWFASIALRLSMFGDTDPRTPEFKFRRRSETFK